MALLWILLTIINAYTQGNNNISIFKKIVIVNFIQLVRRDWMINTMNISFTKFSRPLDFDISYISIIKSYLYLLLK